MDTKFRVEGDKEFIAKLETWAAQIPRYTQAAGKEAAAEVLDSDGIKKYPAAGPGNAPPVPYYIRGVGTQHAVGNELNSERYGSKWQVSATGYQTLMINYASYSGFVGGDIQAGHMAKIGWRKVVDVVRDKWSRVLEIYAAWIRKGIKDAGL